MTAQCQVFFVGAGPGTKAYLVARASQALGRADVVFVDAEVPADVLEGVGTECRTVRVGPGGVPALVVVEKMVAAAREGQVVVRLVEGDPLAHPHVIADIKEVARAGMPFEIVPGLAPAWACAATTGAPLVSSEAQGGVVAQVADPRKAPWPSLAPSVDTLLLETDGAGVGMVVEKLLAQGRNPDTPAWVVVNPCTSSQKVLRGLLADVATRARSVRSGRIVLLVGEGLSESDPLQWFEHRPLAGKRILLTRAEEQAGPTAHLLRERGAEPVRVPMIAFRPVDGGRPLAEAVARMPSAYDWVAFTSANGVQWTFAEVRRQRRDARAFGNLRIAAIGPGTASALHDMGLTADVVAEEFRGEGLADEVLKAMAEGSREGSPRGQRVLIPRAKEAREVFPESLRAAGCDVDVVPAYETYQPDGARDVASLLTQGAVDVALFTSSSTVTGLCSVLGPDAPTLLSTVCVASIGPITSATLRDKGIRVDVTATTYTIRGVLDALEGHYRLRLN